MENIYLTNMSVKRKEKQMKNFICVNVSCLLRDGQEEKVYYYFGKDSLLFNGCESSCGSVFCEKCGEDNYSKTLYELKLNMRNKQYQ